MTRHTAPVTPAVLRRTIAHLESAALDEFEDILKKAAAGQESVGPLITPPLAWRGAPENA